MKIQYYSKELLKYLLVAGIVAAGSVFSPQLPYTILCRILSHRKINKKKSSDCFRYLLKRKLITLERNGHDTSIILTPEGKKRAGKYQIDELQIMHPKKWDGKWRVVIFDIPSHSDFVRNVFRKKLKELGFYLMQKSAWVYPFECKKEISLLRDFLGADEKQVRVLEINHIENDHFLRNAFHV
jgi:hypothetical protein